jgi:transposase
VQHVAIDLGSSKSQVCVREADERITLEKVVRTAELPMFLQSLPQSRVIIETCAESFMIADVALAAGHEVRVVPSTLARQLGVGAHGVKTDRRDAQALSAVSCKVDLRSVHIRSPLARERLTRLGMRHAMVTARTQLINCVKGWLRTQLQSVRSASERFPKNVRELLLEQPSGIPAYVEGLLKSIEELNQQIGEADAEMKKLAQANEVCARLMTVPGVGPITATAFVAAIDDVSRFKKAEELESYLGLTPGERSSSKKMRRTGITKAGPTIVRHVLTQAALTLWRVRPTDPAVRWAEEIKARRGKQVAVIALARKLSGFLFAMWRDETNYQPQHSARQPTREKEVAA